MSWIWTIGHRTYPLLLVLAAFLMASLFMTQMKPWISYQEVTYEDSCMVVIERLDIKDRACYINDSLVIKASDLKFLRPAKKNLFKRIEKGDTLIKPENCDTIRLSKDGVTEEFPLVMQKSTQPKNPAQ